MLFPGKITKQGDQGATVKNIQRQLNIKGYGPLVVDWDFGSKTLADLEAFQQANLLPATGEVDAKTWNALFQLPVPSSNISGLALQVITAQLGQKEVPHGSNSGPMVNEYLKSVGLNPGYAWCQALVYWSYNHAAQQSGLFNPVVRTAGVMDCWGKTPEKQKITAAAALANPKLILPGYQMILDYGHGSGHTGLVESVNGTILTTIEGNSNTDGSRDGEMVVRQTKRTLKQKLLKGFIKY